MDKDLLFKPRLPEADVDIPGVGTVRVRGLNREETFKVGRMDDKAEAELHIIALGMVDPELSVSEVRRWAQASPGGELDAVQRKIGELSGLIEEAPKSGVPGVRGDAGDGVRVLPGGEAGDDGGPAADGDAG